MSDLETLSGRIQRLEDWRHTKDIAAAGDAERQKHLDERFDRLEQRIDGINGSIGRILWIVGGAVVAALANFILNGGLVG